MDGYGVIAANDEAENNVYIVFCQYLPYTLQEDVESYGNQLTSGDLVCDAIYTSPVWNKLKFYFDPYKKSVTVSMNTVDIKNLDVNVWTPKSEFPQGNFLRP